MWGLRVGSRTCDRSTCVAVMHILVGPPRGVFVALPCPRTGRHKRFLLNQDAEPGQPQLFELLKVKPSSTASYFVDQSVVSSGGSCCEFMFFVPTVSAAQVVFWWRLCMIPCSCSFPSSSPPRAQKLLSILCCNLLLAHLNLFMSCVACVLDFATLYSQHAMLLGAGTQSAYERPRQCFGCLGRKPWQFLSVERGA